MDNSIYILILVIAAVLFWKWKMAFSKKNISNSIILILLTLILFLPLLPWYYNFVDVSTDDKWSSDAQHQRWNSENFKENLNPYIVYLTRWNYYPEQMEIIPKKNQTIFQYLQFLVLLILVIMSSFTYKKTRKFVFLISFFIVFYLLYGAKGDFMWHMFRWCLSLSIPLALLLANSMVCFKKKLSKIIHNKSILNVILLFIVIILFWNPFKLIVPERKAYPNQVIMIKEECGKLGKEPYLYFNELNSIVHLLCKSKYPDIGRVSYAYLKESINKDLRVGKDVYIFYQKESLTPLKPKEEVSVIKEYLPYLKMDFDLTIKVDNDLLAIYKVKNKYS